MVTKNQIKLITSLQQKKYRVQHSLFVAEGNKVISELLESNLTLNHLYTTEAPFQGISPQNQTQITEAELNKISALTTPNACLAVFKISQPKAYIDQGLVVALDAIRDPGNLGTILRLCDWFGIEQIICSTETVDLYNPKVIQATMGSIARVSVIYCDLHALLQTTKLPVYGTFMSGINIYQTKLAHEGIIVFGNEANGISETIVNFIQHRITIPRFGKLKQTESLNVSTAAAVVLSEFNRDFNEK